MAKTYCSNCGEAVDGVAFCAVCGTAVAGAAPAAGSSTTEAPAYAAPAAGNTGKSLQTGRLTFVEAIKSFFANYVNFEGRATQSAYWFAVLFNFIVSMVVSSIQSGAHMSDSFGSGALSNLLSLAFLLPGLSVAIRRMHDTGRSGTYLLWALLPIVGWILVIVAAAAKSQDADNKYGPRP
jgi:uncharacterized membrane protein YhaH (DUF805 family)